MKVEQILKQVKKDFKEHKAKLIKHSDSISELIWKKEGTSCYAINYIFMKNKLYISGDLGSAVLIVSDLINLNWFQDVSVYYFTQKLECHSRDLYLFDEKKALKDLKENKDNFTKENYNIIKDIINNSSVFDEYQRNLYHNQELDYDSMEYSDNYGRYLNPSFYYQLEGLKLAYKQLIKEEK